MIPTYRAKKTDNNDFTEGYLLAKLKRYNDKSFIVNDFTRFQGLTSDREIDEKTLAIHYPNMIDKNGKKMFAALDKNGIGGDILMNSKTGEKFLLYIDKSTLFIHPVWLKDDLRDVAFYMVKGTFEVFETNIQ